MTWKPAFIFLISCFVSCISLQAKLSPQEEARLSSLAEKVGELYQSGKFAEAIPMAQECLVLAEKALGPDHPESATQVNNLAELYRSMGDYAKAEALFQRALKIDEKALGPDHPNVARDLNNLALLYKSKGEYERVEPLYLRAGLESSLRRGAATSTRGACAPQIAGHALADIQLAALFPYFRLPRTFASEVDVCAPCPRIADSFKK